MVPRPPSPTLFPYTTLFRSLRSEEEVGLVRGLMRVYRPVLAFLLDRPAGIVWFVGLTFILGAAPLGDVWLRVAVAAAVVDRKSTRLNSSHGYISYAVFCLKK